MTGPQIAFANLGGTVTLEITMKINILNLQISFSVSYKIHALLIFNFLVYLFHKNVDFLENHIQPNFNLFPKTGIIFTPIRSREGYLNSN